MMTLHTVIGLACFDAEFRAALFGNPRAALREHCFCLTRLEYEALKRIISAENNEEIKTCMAMIGDGGCPDPPCLGFAAASSGAQVAKGGAKARR